MSLAIVEGMFSDGEVQIAFVASTLILLCRPRRAQSDLRRRDVSKISGALCLAVLASTLCDMCASAVQTLDSWRYDCQGDNCQAVAQAPTDMASSDLGGS